MYDSLSKYYDLFADSDDESRAGYIASFLPEGGRGADLGCGTGGVTLALKKRGFDVTGFDSSEGMLAAAYERAADSGETVDFVLKDVFRGGFGKNLDFVIACCDVVNYVSRPLGFFKKVYDSLSDAGVFAFDVSSEYKLKNILGNNTFTDTVGGVTYIWVNSLFAKSVDMFLTFFALRPDGTYDKTVDEQTQYIHKREDLVGALKEAGFDRVKEYGYGTRSNPAAKCERIFFVCTKSSLGKRTNGHYGQNR